MEKPCSTCPRRSHPFCRHCWEIQVWAQPHKNDANPPKAAPDPAALPLLPPLPSSFLGAVQQSHPSTSPVGVTRAGDLLQGLAWEGSPSSACSKPLPPAHSIPAGLIPCWVPCAVSSWCRKYPPLATWWPLNPPSSHTQPCRVIFPQCSLFNGMRKEEFKRCFPN